MDSSDFHFTLVEWSVPAGIGEADLEDAIADHATPEAPTAVVVCNFSNLTPQLQRNANKSFKDRGYLSHPSSDPYVVVYTNQKVVKKDFTRFSKTAQNRGITCIVLDLATTKNDDANRVTLLVTQLEIGRTTDAKVMRRQQFQEVNVALLRASGNVFFAGDLASPSFEKLEFADGISDAWRERGDAESGYTEGMDRMDRIAWRGTDFDAVKFGLGCLFFPRRSVVTRFEAADAAKKST